MFWCQNVFICFLTFSLAVSSCQKKQPFLFEEGDLLFQKSDCGDFCEAINEVTDGIDGIDFNHVGILKHDSNDEWIVLEAVSEGVKETQLPEFLDRAKDNQNQPLVAIGRLKAGYKNALPQAIASGDKFVGKPYDEVFDINNDAYYCSELVYLLYEDSAGNSLFELTPMTFKDPETKETFSIWQEYFDNLSEQIPEGQPGLNPGGISKSEVLDIFFPFSDFKN